MDQGYSITVKENVVLGSAVVANNAITVSDLINYCILAAVLVQLCYTLWKWRKDYKDSKEGK